MRSPEEVVFSPIPLEALAERVERPVAESLLAALPEAVRRARLGEYLNDEQAQEETGLTKRQLRHLRERRRIPYRVVGRTILYRTDELFALIDAGKVPARE
jgi:hypothetical protein